MAIALMLIVVVMVKSYPAPDPYPIPVRYYDYDEYEAPHYARYLPTYYSDADIVKSRIQKYRDRDKKSR